MGFAFNQFYFFKLICILSSIYSLVQAEKLCPEPENIEPCTCSDSITTILECTGLKSDFEMNAVLKNSARYTYQEVHIESAVLLHLPSDLLNNVSIKELYLKDMIFNLLFDKSPNGLRSLYKLEIDNSKFMRSLTWESITSLKNLKELKVANTSVEVLGSSFRENAPPSLRRISFYDARIKRIRPGTLKNLVKLDRFAVQACRLSKLTRDIFPTPFNGRFLYFDDNKISSIPDDLFHDMPKLQFLSLKNNGLSVLPQSAFGERSQNLPVLKLEENPLNCDCELEWIVKDKPEVLRGTCASPQQLSGRKLKDLVLTDFKC